MGTGRPKKYSQEHLVLLREIVAELPFGTLAEIGRQFESRAGFVLHRTTLARALSEAGIERIHAQDLKEPEPDTATDAAPPRYGYTNAHRSQQPEQRYASSLSDEEWALVADIFENRGPGQPPKYSRRLLLDACCYVVRTGCSWRMLPKDFPAWQNVYRTFRRWSGQGKFEEMHDRLRAQWRSREAKEDSPTAAVIDAQSTRHSPQGGEAGYDAGKKVKGRKRHIVVDTLGLLLAVSVTAASVQDRDGAHPVMSQTMTKYPTVEVLFADTGYAGKCAQTISQRESINVEVVRHPRNRNVGHWKGPEQSDMFMKDVPTKGFVVLPKRWVVERTHAWIEKARRLIMHHDRLTSVSTSWVWLAGARMLLNRLTSNNT